VPERELLTESLEIVKLAAEHGATLRLMVGLAVRFHCRLKHPEHNRTYHDIDLFGLSKETESIRWILEKLGHSYDHKFNSLGSGERLRFHDKEDHDIDIFLDKFKMQHIIDFRTRLHLDNFTIPITDLLLTKLQNVKLAAKDAVDIISLLEDHSVGSNDNTGVLNLVYIADICADDWGLWRSVTGNVDKISEWLQQGDYIAIDRTDVIRKLTSIRQAIDSKGKTFPWKLRASVGEKVQWYFDVEE